MIRHSVARFLTCKQAISLKPESLVTRDDVFHAVMNSASIHRVSLEIDDGSDLSE